MLSPEIIPQTDPNSVREQINQEYLNLQVMLDNPTQFKLLVLYQRMGKTIGGRLSNRPALALKMLRG